MRAVIAGSIAAIFGGVAAVALVVSGGENTGLVHGGATVAARPGFCRHRVMQLAFEDGAGVAVVDVDGRHLREVASVDDSYEPSWSPDGTRIAFASLSSGIYTVGVDGNGLQQLTPDALSAPEWFPSGEQIYYQVDVQPGFHTEAANFVMNADGSGRRQIPDASVPLTWSPDGGRFVARTESGISIVNADGSGQRDLNLGDVTDVLWAPVGGQIAVVVVGGHKYVGIGVVNAGGGARRMLTRILGVEYLSWSPDGARIAFQVGFDQIWVVNANGGGLRRLEKTTPPGSLGFGIQWSPDGNWIAFEYQSHPRPTVPEIYLMRPDGTDLHSLTRHLPLPQGGVGASSPVWRPCIR